MNIATIIVFTSLICYHSHDLKRNNDQDNIQSYQFIKIGLSLKANFKAKLESDEVKSKYIIKRIKNPLIDKNGKKRYSQYKQCVFKSGTIDMIIQRPLPGSPIITTTPVFVMITKDEFTIYKDLSRNELIQKINLKNIQRVDQHYSNTLCFDVILSTTEIKSGLISFCGESKDHFNIWLSALLEFKQCMIIIKSNEDSKLLVDLKKVKKKTIIAPAENVLSDLYYDGEDKFYKKTKLNESIDESIMKAIELIKKNKTRANLAKRSIKRKFSGKMRNSHSFSHTFMNTQAMFKRKMENKIANERETEFKALRAIHKPKELGLLKEVVKRINQLKVSNYFSY